MFGYHLQDAPVAKRPRRPDAQQLGLFIGYILFFRSTLGAFRKKDKKRFPQRPMRSFAQEGLPSNDAGDNHLVPTLGMNHLVLKGKL